MTGVRRSWRAVAVLGALAVLLAGCGARWDDEQRAAVLARGEGTGALASGDGATAGPDGVPADGVTGTTVAGTATGSGGSTDGGTTGGGTTGGATGGAAAAGARPCAAASKAPGVTDGEIKFGTITSVSGPVPGLGQSSLDAVRAYAAYRNSTGGVCGRKITVQSADDGTDAGRYRSLVNDLNTKVLGLAGGLGGGDSGGASTVEQLGMPVVSGHISRQMLEAKTMFAMNPKFANVNAVIGKYRWLREQGVKKAAVVYLGIDQTRYEVLDKQIPQMKAAGIQVAPGDVQELPLATLSYDSAARKVANAKVDYLFFLADYTQSAGMARAMAGTGYKPKFSEYLTAYSTKFHELAGPGAEGAISWIRSLPNEEPTNPEQQQFLSWMKKVAPNSPADSFAADAWAASKAWADALEALPGPISREAVLAQLRATKEFDAGGFFGKIQLGPKVNNGCFVAMRYEGGRWKRMTPASGFLC